MALYTLQTNWWEIKEVGLEWSGDNSIEGENRERKECQAGEEGFLLICSLGRIVSSSIASGVFAASVLLLARYICMHLCVSVWIEEGAGSAKSKRERDREVVLGQETTKQNGYIKGCWENYLDTVFWIRGENLVYAREKWVP